jgi:hypothetical protein
MEEVAVFFKVHVSCLNLSGGTEKTKNILRLDNRYLRDRIIIRHLPEGNRRTRQRRRMGILNIIFVIGGQGM